MGRRVILPKDRDPRFVTIRRGGFLTDSDHRLLALWAASCAEHVLDLFEFGAAGGRAAAPRDRTRASLGARRDHHDPGSHRGRACDGRRQRSGWGSSTCRVRHRPGRRRSARRRARARCGRLRDQGRTGCSAGRRGREGGANSSAGGSAISSRRRFASSCSMISDCATTSAGRCSTVERGSGRRNRQGHPGLSHWPDPPCHGGVSKRAPARETRGRLERQRGAEFSDTRALTGGARARPALLGAGREARESRHSRPKSGPRWLPRRGTLRPSPWS